MTVVESLPEYQIICKWLWVNVYGLENTGLICAFIFGPCHAFSALTGGPINHEMTLVCNYGFVFVFMVSRTLLTVIILHSAGMRK